MPALGIDVGTGGSRAVLVGRDYVPLRRTGERATNVADASGTLLFDVTHRKSSEAMLEAMRLDLSWLPRAFEGPEVTGGLSSEAARETGLHDGTPIVAPAATRRRAPWRGCRAPGCRERHARHLRRRACHDRRASVRRGRPVHTFCHAVSGRWLVMGVTQAAGLSRRWFRDTLATSDGRAASRETLIAEAATVPPGSDGVLYAPYLMGEPCSHAAIPDISCSAYYMMGRS